MTSRIKRLPVLVQLGKDVKLLRAVGVVEVLGLRVADHFGFEFESEGASLELFFFFARQITLLLVLLHRFAFVRYSTKSPEGQFHVAL